MNKYKPGAGRRKKYAFDKGRQLDPISISELRNILGDMEIRRDLLITEPKTAGNFVMKIPCCSLSKYFFFNH